MLDEAKFRGSQTPGIKYTPNLNAIRPKSAALKIIPNNRVSGQRMKDARITLLKKDRSKPCVGTYKVEECLVKT